MAVFPSVETSCPAYPTILKTSVEDPSFLKVMLNLPFSSVDVPAGVPFCLTVTPGTGTFAASVTFPVIFVWAKTSQGISKNANTPKHLFKKNVKVGFIIRVGLVNGSVDLDKIRLVYQLYP